MLIIYTGNGKGKTSATVGQAIRAFGQGFTVAFGQFMKRDVEAGEQKVCATLFKERFTIGGIGFFLDEKDKDAHREPAVGLLHWAIKQLAEVDMLLLDEALYALGSGLISKEELLQIIQTARTNGAHLVLSGRGLPDWLKEEADLVTEMTEIKHPYATGKHAEKGIEF